jgi:hypothetical protein
VTKGEFSGVKGQAPGMVKVRLSKDRLAISQTRESETIGIQYPSHLAFSVQPIKTKQNKL